MNLVRIGWEQIHTRLPRYLGSVLYLSVRSTELVSGNRLGRSAVTRRVPLHIQGVLLHSSSSSRLFIQVPGTENILKLLASRDRQ